MSFTSIRESFNNLKEYDQLVEFKANITGYTQKWLDRGIALHGNTSDAGEKAEIIALRDALIAELRVILGV